MDIQFWYWWVLALLILIAELTASTGFYLLWPAAAAVVTGGLAWLFPDLGWDAQVLVFAVLSVIALLLWHGYRRGRTPVASDRPLLNRRARQYVGQTVRLVQAISGGIGRAQVGDTVWSVRGPELPEGTLVRVTDVDGTTLIVVSVDDDAAAAQPHGRGEGV